MCGIAGFFHPEGRREGPWDMTLRQMTGTLVHRGPDGEGFFLDEYVGLGHRRLAIIDRAGGTQPMANDDGRVQVIFNGEIYNDLELRERLARRGHRFRTASDTEAIVRAYEEWGVDCVEHLEGMFAFAVWDATQRRLLLARDRLGKKPLYYAMGKGGSIAFASELKGLRPFPGIDRSIDVEALSDYLSLSYVPREKSIFRGVRKLLPAHCLDVGAAQVRLRSYWDLSFAVTRPHADDTLRVREALAQAVRVRMRSEVPLGAFLSGGLDSSTVVGLMVESGARPLVTTAVGFAEETHDERPVAREVAAFFGTQHDDAELQPRSLDLLDTLQRVYDEPFADASALPTYLLSGLTHARVGVALSGDGGDEVFAGYRRYLFDMRENRVRNWLPKNWRQRLLPLIAGLYPESESLAPFLRGKAFFGNLARTPWDAYFHSLSAVDTAEKELLLQPDLRATLAGYRSEGMFDDLYHRADGPDCLSRIQYIDCKTYLPDEILTKVDRASMAHSLEVRCPLLDRRLVELVASLPAARKLNGGRTKVILREAVADLVPRRVLQRRKMGFAVPLASWLQAAPSLVAERLLHHPRLHEWIVPAEVRRIWEEHRSGRYDRSRALWALLVFSAWLDAESEHA